MKIQIKSNGMDLKVLKETEELKLENFTVITGENGSGKTQLLKWIKYCSKRFIEFNEKDEGFVKNDLDEYYRNVVLTLPGITETQEVQQLLMQNINSMHTEWENINSVAKDCVHSPNLKFENISEELPKINTLSQQHLNNRIMPSQFGTPSLNYRQITITELEKVLILSTKANKRPEHIEYIDYLTFYEIPNSIFSPNIDLLFHQFELKKKYYPDLVQGLEYPIDILNRILTTANFNYRAKYIFTNDGDFRDKVTLIDIGNATDVSFSDLSSGEKTIMALIFTLYNSTSNGEFPDLILFDEPDAFLHPSMTKMFLEVVQDVIVKQNKVNVIITTHSPSTIAMAPEESIYYMKRDVGYPEKMNKGEAINSLIYGINGLFVSHENRRQVFVESENDEEYYEGVYLQLKDMLSKDVQLNFISSGTTKIDINGDEIATCERVEIITSTLRGYENKQIFGIIDWDLKNCCKEAITILGQGKRHSIENYLLDPLLIGLMLERESHFSFHEMGIVDKTYTDLKTFTQQDFQKISDFIIAKIIDLAVNVPDVSKDEMVDSKLINGMTLQIPKWFTHHHGHLLEEGILKKLPKLKDVKRGKEKGLKLAIINKLLKDTPTILSNDFLAMFQYLHS